MNTSLINAKKASWKLPPCVSYFGKHDSWNINFHSWTDFLQFFVTDFGTDFVTDAGDNFQAAFFALIKEVSSFDFIRQKYQN